MRSLRDEVEEIPITIVVAIAYCALAVATGMFRDDGRFAERLDDHGWLTPLQAAAGEPWRLLTHAFLHGGAVHLLFNMVMLWAIGPGLERSLGSLRFALLYLGAALGGALAVCVAYHPLQPVVGGSGALFGMMGAAVAINMRSGRHVLAFLEFEGPRRLLGMIVVNLLLGWLLPMVSNTAHVGGLLAGFVLTLLWLRPPAPSALRARWQLAIAALAVGLTFWSLVPVTRVDWLEREAMRATGEQREALLRAAALAHRGD